MSLSPPVVHPSRANVPVLISVPHAGRDYPDWLLASSKAGHRALHALEDPFVDDLVWRAIQRGCAAVIARTPRAAVDCNRAEDEIDPSVVDGASRGRVTSRARGGLGIVPGRTQQHGYLWRRPINRDQLEERVAQAHRPYHEAIEQQLAVLLDRFGCALLLDCHSMPPPPAGIPPIVFGDCRGRTAHPWLSAEAVAIAQDCGFAAGLNDPFAGGHIIERHSGSGVQALQIEIDRRVYLDRGLSAPGPGFEKLAGFLETLVARLGEAMLGRRFATAAE